LHLSQALFVLGLFIDIVGAFVLAQGFIVKRLHTLTWEGTSGYGSPPNIRYIASSLAQKADAQVGFGILACGFLLQTLDYLTLSFAEPLHSSISRTCVLVASVAIAGTLYLASVGVRRALTRRYSRNMIPHVLRGTGEATPNTNWVQHVVAQLAPQDRQREGETDSAFVGRILGAYPANAT